MIQLLCVTKGGEEGGLPLLIHLHLSGGFVTIVGTTPRTPLTAVGAGGQRLMVIPTEESLLGVTEIVFNNHLLL